MAGQARTNHGPQPGNFTRLLMTTPIALTIAGSDSSGGAGIQADLKTFAALGVYGASVITALTAQNTQGVSGIHQVPAEFVTAQIDAVFSDLTVGAVKIGMVAHPPVIDAIVAGLKRWSPKHVVLDPVMVATSGDRLLAAAERAPRVSTIWSIPPVSSHSPRRALPQKIPTAPGARSPRRLPRGWRRVRRWKPPCATPRPGSVRRLRRPTASASAMATARSIIFTNSTSGRPCLGNCSGTHPPRRIR